MKHHLSHYFRRLTLAFLAGSAPLAPADEFTSWEWLVPKPAGNILTKIVFDGARFVGVGDLGIILTSPNGTNWNLAYTDATNRLFNVFAGSGRLLATGDGSMNSYIISTNADVWAWGPLIFGTGGIGTICYGLDRYVMAAGAPQHFYHSSDTTEWQQLAVDLPNGVGDMAFGAGMFVAVGGQGLIATSTNGVDWVERESGTEGILKAVAYGDGRWVAVGGEGASGVILTSEDGITWFLQETDKQLVDVAFGPFGFIATGGLPMGGGVSLTSGDGVYFSGGSAGESGLDDLPNGVACGNGVCVAVGGGGRIWTTTDGTNWVSQTSGPHSGIHGFASDGQRLVAAGEDGTLLVSEDGQNFEDRTVSTGEHFLDVIHTGSRYVAVGARGLVRTSVDGWNWQWENLGTNATLYAAAHGSGRTVVVGWDADGKPYGLFAVREESGLWQIIRPAENEYIFTQIAFGNGRFVAAGYDGNVWVSSDGLQWLKRNVGVSQTLQPLQFIQGRFMAFTRTEVGFSDDGFNWSFVPGNPPTTREITFGNGLYLSASRAGNGQDQFGAHVSHDGVHWIHQPLKSLDFSAATYFKDSFYLSGFILKSASSLVPQFERKVFLPDLVLFDLFGKVGRDYELQSSGDLIAWELEAEYHQATRLHTVTRPAAPGQRFYRVKLKE